MADETFPHLDGERRDEEIALAQWQWRRIAELEADVARLTGERDGALDLLIARRMERDDAREALRHAEEHLEVERQRVDRLMAVEHEHHDVAFCNVCGGLRGQHDEYDGDPSYERQVDEDGRTLPDRCGEWTTPTEAVREIKRLMAVERAARDVSAKCREYEESDVSSIALLESVDVLRAALEATDGE